MTKPKIEADEPQQNPCSTSARPPATRRGLSVKEEAFAVARASGATATDAFLRTYQWNGKKEHARQQAAVVESRDRVTARIKELRDQYATAAIEASRGKPESGRARPYQLMDAMNELDLVMEIARAKESVMAMIKVIELRMKLYGLGISEARNPKDVNEIPPEELEAALAQLREMRLAKKTLN